jgi:hypothetical protein
LNRFDDDAFANLIAETDRAEIVDDGLLFGFFVKFVDNGAPRRPLL